LDTSILNYRYAYPIKLFEYLSLGKIVIATETFATAEIIQHGVNGFLVKNDADMIRATLEKIVAMRADGMLDEIQTHARGSAGNYRWDAINQKLLSRLKDSINRIREA
jgi:glycosyltransferase involved in cell wall biosynthesis